MTPDGSVLGGERDECKASHASSAVDGHAPAPWIGDLDDRREERAAARRRGRKALMELAAAIKAGADDAYASTSSAYAPEDFRGVTASRSAAGCDQCAVSGCLPGPAGPVVEEVADDRACVNPRNVWRSSVGWSGIGNGRADASGRGECGKHSHVWDSTQSAQRVRGAGRRHETPLPFAWASVRKDTLSALRAGHLRPGVVLARVRRGRVREPRGRRARRVSAARPPRACRAAASARSRPARP
jgi:hypothetical protein